MTGSKSSRLLRVLFPIIGIGLLLASFAWAVWIRHFDDRSMIVGAVGVLLFLTIFVRGELANLKHYLNISIYTAFAAGTCVVIYLLVGRHSFQTDFTPQKIHTLSEGTEKYLGLLKKDVEIVVFDSEDQPYRPLLDRYAVLSPHVQWNIYDPRKADPSFVREFDENVTEKLIYIRSGEKPNQKKKRISLGEMSENSITNGIVEVTRDRKINVYFLTGHGEVAFEKAAPETPSLSTFREFLASRAMDVAELDLIQRGFIPQDATLLVLAGPKRDLYPVEVRQLDAFLTSGGSMLVFFDLPGTTGESIDYTNLRQLLQPRGINDEEKVIVDLQGGKLLGNPLKIPVLWFSGKHPIVLPTLKAGRTAIAVPLVRGLTPVDPPARGVTVSPLIGSSHDSWLEPFLSLGGKVDAPQKLDVQYLAWASEAKRGGAQKNGMRLAVFGSSEFIRNGYIDRENTDAILMLSTVNWLVEQDDYVPVPERVIAGTPLVLNDGELKLILILIVMAFPSIIFFGGIIFSQLTRGA